MKNQCKDSQILSIINTIFTYCIMRKNAQDLAGFTEDTIWHLQANRQFRTAETYEAALRSFQRFLGAPTLAFREITPTLIARYEVYLAGRGLSRNTSSFYMRILRAIYNRAVDAGLVRQRSPFRHVYTGVDKTRKRAVPLSVIRRIKHLDLSGSPSLTLARDLFLFSFYTRGMSFVDMAGLTPGNLNGGYRGPHSRQPERGISPVHPPEDRPADQHPLGTVHAGDRRPLPGYRHGQAPAHRRPDRCRSAPPVQDGLIRGQQGACGNLPPVKAGLPTYHLCRQTFLGKHCLCERNPPFSHFRRDGTRFGKSNAGIPRIRELVGRGQSEQADSQNALKDSESRDGKMKERG